VLFLESVGDVFQENEAENDVLVFGGVEIAAKLISGGLESLLEAEV